MEIYKPLGNIFSISDKVYGYIQRGYTAHIKLPTRSVKLDKETSYARKEEVKSKYAGSPSWYRYWFKIEAKQKQMSFI